MTTETPAPNPASTVSFMDNPLAPDVYADNAVGFLVNNGIVKITFVSARVNHIAAPGPVNNVVIGRLVMSIAGAQSLSVGLYDFLKSHGLAPSGAKPN